MEKTMKARVQHKHDIEANWLKAINFTPLASEIIVYDPDENYDYPRIKIGDGKTNINSLPFVTKDYAKISDIPTKPEDIGALPDSTVIPTVPTKISAFENDKGYLTQHQSLEGLATEEWVEEKFEEHSDFVAQPEAPEDTSVLWLDTDDDNSNSSGNVDLTGYATEDWVEKHFLPLTALEGTGSATEAITADDFEIGGILATDGNDAGVTATLNRARTVQVDCTVSNFISVACNSSVKWLVHFFNNGTWIGKTSFVSDNCENVAQLWTRPDDVTHIRILVAYANDANVADIADLVGNFTITKHISGEGIIATKEWVAELLGGIENGTY